MQKAVDKQKAYNAMSAEEKHKYNFRFEQLKTDLWIAVKKIVDGRIASLCLYKTLKDVRNIDDISMEALLTVFNYINRYNEYMNTSAFAFVTQIAYNSIVGSLAAIRTHETVMLSGLDFFDNLNTIDNPTGKNNMSRFIEESV